jgi:tRNA (guanine37-N1)-methyltransferase
MEVPEVLLSGNHQAVARWRREQSARRRTIVGDEKKEGDLP